MIDCAAVLTSRFSRLLGVPISVYAGAWFVIAFILEYAKKRAARFWALLGIAGVVYSVIAMTILGRICIYCSSLDAIILAYVAIVLWGSNAKT